MARFKFLMVPGWRDFKFTVP